MTRNPMDLLASLPVERGRWADSAVDFQRRDAEAVLDPNGRPFHFQTRPRGGRKTADAAGYAVALHLTVAPPGARSYVVAADAAQAGLVIDTIRGFLHRERILSKRIKIEARRVIFLEDGDPVSTVEVLPADEASSYGLRPYLVICDELSVWPNSANAKGMWAAVLSAMPKVEGSKLVVVTSAGAPDHWSAAILEHARTSPQWRVSEVPGPLPWVPAEVLDEQRALLTASAYARLHENKWVAGEDRLTTPEQVRDCIGHSGVLPPQRGNPYVLGLDIGLVNDRTVLTVGHAENRDGAVVVVVDHQEVWQGSKRHPVDLNEVESYVRETVRKYPGKIVFDPWQSVHLAQRLRGRGVSVEAFTFSSASVGHLALTLYRLLRDRLLDLPDDDELVAELSSVVLRENQPGVYRIDTTGQGHDDRVISLALVAQKLASQWSGTSRIRVAQGRIPSTTPSGRARAMEKQSTNPSVVGDGEQRPVDRLVRFQNARRHPGWQPPRPR